MQKKLVWSQKSLWFFIKRHRVVRYVVHNTFIPCGVY